MSLAKVNAAIIESGTSKDAIAQVLGTTVVYVRNKLSGNAAFTLKDLEAIQALTGKPFDYFFAE